MPLSPTKGQHQDDTTLRNNPLEFLRAVATRSAAVVETKLTRHSSAWLILFIAGLAASSVAIAVRNRLWLDEIFTYYLVQQPSVSEILRAVREGDAAAPANSLLIRAVQLVLGNSILALRLPSIAGFCVWAAGIFIFVRRSLPPIYAAIGMLAALNVTLPYATEARSYGAELGCIMAALLCWQSAANQRSRRLSIPGLGIILAGAIALHYYALLVLFPLLAAEFVRWRSSRKLDGPILAALLLSPLVLIPHLPLIGAASQYVTHFWAKEFAGGLVDFYQRFFERVVWYGGMVALGAAFFSSKRSDPDPSESRFSQPELILCAGLALAPPALVALSRFTPAAYVDRYVLFAVIGVSMLGAAAFFRLAYSRPVVAPAVLLALMGLFAKQTLSEWRDRDFRVSPTTLAMRDKLASLPGGALPIVVDDDRSFMELAFYAQSPVRERLTVLLNSGLSLKYTHSDTIPLILSAWRSRIPLSIQGYDDFLASHRSFYVINAGTGWRLWHLAYAGYKVTPAEEGNPPALYLLEAP